MNVFVRILILTVTIFAALTALLGWSIFTALSALLTALTLVLVRDGIAPRSRVRGWLTTAWMYWGLSFLSNLIEAAYLGVVPRKAATSGVFVDLLIALGVAGILEALTTPGGDTPVRPTSPAPGLWWRIPMLACIFFLTYLAAGAAVFPWVAAFYAHLHLPPLGELLRLQLCRGVLDLACIYPVFWQWQKTRQRAVWASACVFAVLCGWGPLLLPNQYMPGSIRLAHAAEMGASGIVFGAIAALVLLRRAPEAAPSDEHFADVLTADSEAR
jgi:hypothetical protein